MRIVQRLNLLRISGIVGLFFIVLTLFWSWNLVSIALERQAYARQVESQANLLQMETFEQHQSSPRNLVRWSDISSNFSQLLASVPKLTPNQQVIQNSINTQNESIGLLHRQLIQLNNSQPIKKHLNRRLLLQIEIIREDSMQLAAIAEREIRETVERQVLLLFLVFIMGFGLVMFSSQSVITAVKYSIDEIKQAMDALQQGRYEEIRLSHKSNEFSSFVEKFNQMCLKLKKTTVTRDVLQQIVDERTEVLKKLAGTDTLTQIANRRTLFERGAIEFSRAKRQNESLSLLMIDCDYFKKINDTYGHSVGDNVLVHLCRTCEKQIRNIDFFARFGGEEFVMLLPNCGLADGLEKARLIQKALDENPLYKDSKRIKLTVSIGLSCISKAHQQFEDLLNNADDALLKAKLNGRNQVVVSKN